MAESSEETQRRRRRKRLIQGLLVGGAALGLPALINALVARNARRLPARGWGRRERYRTADGDLLFQRLGSEGPVVVLLHALGPGHSGLQWRAVAELLATSYRVLVPDLIGWGDSDHHPRTFDGDFYIQLLIDFLADVAEERVCLVAAGLPAAYAVQLAVDHPEQLSALGLVAPLGIGLHGDEPDLRDAVVHRLLRLPILGTSALNIFTSRAGIAHHLRREVFADPERATDLLIEQHYRTSHRIGAHAALAAYVAGYLNHEIKDILGRVDAPTWLAWGRETRSPSIEAADLWLHELPQAELTVFEDCGLLPHAEAPDEFATELLAFLGRTLRA